MTRLLFLFLATVTFAPGFATESPGANVRIVAVTPAGKLLKPISVLEFSSLKNRKESYAQRFRGETADHIPLGEYLITVHADDRDISQVIKVLRSHTLIVVSGSSFIVDPAPSAESKPRGRVLGIQGKGFVWVKLVHAFAEDFCCTIAPVSENGDFFSDGTVDGDYVLLVLHDSGVLFQRLIHIQPDKPSIIVDIEKGTVEFR